MPEVSLGGSDDDETKSSGGGGSVSDIVDNLDRVKDWLSENPEIARAAGVEIPEITMDETNVNADGGEVTPQQQLDMLLNVGNNLIEAGYGNYSVEQVIQYVENNPEEVKKHL